MGVSDGRVVQTEKLVEDLRAYGLVRGASVGVGVAAGIGIGVATVDRSWSLVSEDPVGIAAVLETTFRPRWVWWSADTPELFVAHGLRVATCWDITAVHRLLYGGWRADTAIVWARLRGVSLDSIPSMGQLDLLSAPIIDDGNIEHPIQSDGHLRPDWTAGGWAAHPARLARWASLALETYNLQRTKLIALDQSRPHAKRAEAVAKSESAAELLCSELGHDGLPIDVGCAEQIIERFVGPRPKDEAHAMEMREQRDAVVHALAPGGLRKDIRNSAQVLEMLRVLGIDESSTRAWKLEQYRSEHPFVDALLVWRKAERIGSTYGYAWLDEHVINGRLRGGWTSCDGAAGRMTAQAGLHNMPADLRDAVAAEPGFGFVHADLGQIEPRVLAAVSGDRSLSAATQSDDLYAPISSRLNVERPIAKVGMLAAMYGQTSGVAGDVLQQMESAYPVAIEYLRSAERAGQAGNDIRTYGGRLVRMWADPDVSNHQAVRSAAAGRGRYARNAMVQGAAAELFKSWAAIVRARITPLGGQLVMCLHDELLVHAPIDQCENIARIVESTLDEAASYWQPNRIVRFVAVARVIERWSQAK